jgi:hypothetical protein
MLYCKVKSKNEDFRKKLTQGLKVFVRSNLTFISHNLREQTGAEELFLKRFSVGVNKKINANSRVEKSTFSDFCQTLLK